MPIMTGIVVCSEHADAVQKKHFEMETSRVEKEAKKTLDETTDNWKKLLKGLVVRWKMMQVNPDNREAAESMLLWFPGMNS